MPVLTINKVGTTDVKKYVSIKASGKFSFLLANIRNTVRGSIFYVCRTDNGLYQITKLAGNVDAFYFSDSCLITTNTSPWSDYMIIPLTGSIDDVTVVDSVPEDATQLTVL